MNRFVICVYALVAAAVLVPEASAQYMIKLSLDKKMFLSQEPMRATVRSSAPHELSQLATCMATSE